MAFITISDIVNHIKTRCGAAAHFVELSDENITKLIYDVTLKTISIYFPRKENVIIDCERDQVPYAEPGKFFIPTECTVLGISDVIPINCYSAELPGMIRTQQISLGTLATGRLQGMLDTPYTAELLPPNIAYVNPNPYFGTGNAFILVCNVAHDDFNTVHPGLYELIKELAEYDAKIDIYSIRSYFANLKTEFTDIELNLSQYEEAISKRTELLDKIRAKKHLSSGRKKVWVR